MTQTAGTAGTAGMPADRVALSVSGLTRDFRLRDQRHRRVLRAVDDVSFELRSGHTLALVGQSGSGKSTIVRMLARLLHPTAGEIRLDGVPVGRSPRAVRRYRSDVQMIFQDPFASLNPSHPVDYHLRRPLLLHGIAEDSAATRRATLDLLERVNLTPAEQIAGK
ncbi:MAG TPA: ATP-binding cassette domain-containing protein, partial [Mycobacteriales bacterium]|nr:ATP-binding cassette domain-containing protein [Mycobacteriales bacterium]